MTETIDTSDADQAFEQGYLGTVPDPIENEAYTLQGQGEETAQREREVHEQLRTERLAASRDADYGKTSRKSRKKSSG